MVIYQEMIKKTTFHDFLGTYLVILDTKRSDTHITGIQDANHKAALNCVSTNLLKVKGKQTA